MQVVAPQSHPRLGGARTRGHATFGCMGTVSDSRIVRDPAICGGQPIVRGTRVPIRVVLGYLAHGEDTRTILAEFPSLVEDDLRAIIAFAAAAAAEDLPSPTPLPLAIKVA